MTATIADRFASMTDVEIVDAFHDACDAARAAFEIGMRRDMPASEARSMVDAVTESKAIYAEAARRSKDTTSDMTMVNCHVCGYDGPYVIDTVDDRREQCVTCN